MTEKEFKLALVLIGFVPSGHLFIGDKWVMTLNDIWVRFHEHALPTIFYKDLREQHKSYLIMGQKAYADLVGQYHKTFKRID